MVELFANSGDPDQTPHPDLCLHCLVNTLLGVSRLQWVKDTYTILFRVHNKSILGGYLLDSHRRR